MNVCTPARLFALWFRLYRDAMIDHFLKSFEETWSPDDDYAPPTD